MEEKKDEAKPGLPYPLERQMRMVEFINGMDNLIKAIRATRENPEYKERWSLENDDLSSLARKSELIKKMCEHAEKEEAKWHGELQKTVSMTVKLNELIELGEKIGLNSVPDDFGLTSLHWLEGALQSNFFAAHRAAREFLVAIEWREFRRTDYEVFLERCKQRLEQLKTEGSEPKESFTEFLEKHKQEPEPES